MNFRRALILILAFGLAAFFAFTQFTAPAGHPPAAQVIRPTNEAAVRADIRMKKGKMFLEGGGRDIVAAQFEYHSPLYKPQMQYQVFDGIGLLSLVQERVASIGSFAQEEPVNQWRLRMGSAAALDLNVELQQGRAELNLNQLNLRRASINLFEGEAVLTMDQLVNDTVYVSLDTGYGRMIVDLPDDFGIEIKGHTQGLEFEKEGFSKTEEGFRNALFGQSSRTLWIMLPPSQGRVVLR
jgi:hypothetical protein